VTGAFWLGMVGGQHGDNTPTTLDSDSHERKRNTACGLSSFECRGQTPQDERPARRRAARTPRLGLRAGQKPQ